MHRLQALLSAFAYPYDEHQSDRKVGLARRTSDAPRPYEFSGPVGNRKIVHQHDYVAETTFFSPKTTYPSGICGIPSATGVFGRLPPDLIIVITEFHLDHWTTPSDDFFSDYEDTAEIVRKQDWPAQMRVHALSRVNKNWHNALIPVLYWKPVLASARSLRIFASLFRSIPELSGRVKGLILLDRTGDADDDSFFNAMYCANEEIRKETTNALIGLMACREPGALNVSFVTKRNTMIDMSERGGSLLEWRPKSSYSSSSAREILCTALASLRSLALHGYTSHLLYTPSSDWFDTTNMAFRSLRELKLERLHLKQVHWPHLPALTTLMMIDCHIHGTLVPTVETAPALHTVAWFDNFLGYRGINVVSSLLPHATKLTSIFIDRESCQDIIKLADQFLVLRELAMNSYYLPLVHRLTRLPPNLGILRLKHTSHDIYVTFTPEHARRTLDPNIVPVLTRRWMELHIIGDSSFWERVPAQILGEARAVCIQEKVTYVRDSDPFSEC
jgi:hypothetical protein